jgi:meiotically up-regulated gene 157 (Mug157) protein
VNLCYVRLPLLYSDVIYYINSCNTVMPLKCDPAQKIMDDSGFPRTPDRLLKFCGTHVWWLEVFKTITSTCGPYYLGGSTTAGIRAIIIRAIIVWPYKISK